MSTASAQPLRRLVRALVRLYYPRIAVTGRERIPESGPVLLVANHANSLIDAVMIGIASQRPVHFLAKAPLFDIPVFGRVLRAVGMIPAYRGVDDPSQLQRNLDSLDSAAVALCEGKPVAIFPEGKSHDSLKLAMIRSGAARIAMAAVRRGACDLAIVPIGINYQQKEQFGTAVWIQIGSAIFPNTILRSANNEGSNASTETTGNERRALRTLTHEIETKIEEVAIHLSASTWAHYLPHLEKIFPAHAGGDAIDCLKQRKRIADAMNCVYAHDEPCAESVASRFEEQHRSLLSAGLDFDSPILRWRGARLARRLSATVFALMAGLLPALAGSVFHMVPFVLVRGVGRQLPAIGRTTVSMTRLLLGLPVYLGWYIASWWFLTSIMANWMVLMVIVSMPIAGAVALNYWPWAIATIRRLWPQVRMLTRSRGDQLQKLRHDQQLLCEELRALARSAGF